MKNWIEDLERRWHALPEQRRNETLLGTLAVVLGLVMLVAFYDVVSDEVARAEIERPIASGIAPPPAVQVQNALVYR